MHFEYRTLQTAEKPDLLRRSKVKRRNLSTRSRYGISSESSSNEIKHVRKSQLTVGHRAQRAVEIKK